MNNSHFKMNNLNFKNKYYPNKISFENDLYTLADAIIITISKSFTMNDPLLIIETLTRKQF